MRQGASGEHRLQLIERTVVRGSLRALALIAIIGISIVLIARHGGAIFGLREGELVMAVYLIGFLILISGALVRLFRDRFGEAIRAALAWTAVALALLAVYAYRFELRDAADRIMAELVPGRAVARGSTVEFARGVNGDFEIATEVNGARVPMVLDTGASTVMLTRDAALAAGLPAEMIKYNVNVDTANGRAQAAAVTLDRVAVGNLVERGVPALIAQPGQLRTSLLGMSFLARLKSWEVRGDKVTMRGTDAR
jgi:aspartyl protease family protein